jgi:hypothetical protein
MALARKALDLAVLLAECIRKTNRACRFSHLCVEAATIKWQSVSIGLYTS